MTHCRSGGGSEGAESGGGEWGSVGVGEWGSGGVGEWGSGGVGEWGSGGVGEWGSGGVGEWGSGGVGEWGSGGVFGFGIFHVHWVLGFVFRNNTQGADITLSPELAIQVPKQTTSCGISFRLNIRQHTHTRFDSRSMAPGFAYLGVTCLFNYCLGTEHV